MDHCGPHFLRDGVQVHDSKGVPERLHAGRRLLGLDHGYDTEALVPILKVCWKLVAAKEHACIQLSGIFLHK